MGFFDTEDKLYLAEMTFYPDTGYVKCMPEEFNITMGDLFILPKEWLITINNYIVLAVAVLVKHKE